MSGALRVTNVRFTAAAERDAELGLIGYVACVLSPGIRLDGLTVRKTQAGRFMLSFPDRRDGSGRRHPLIWPVDENLRHEFEAQILASVRNAGEVTP